MRLSCFLSGFIAIVATACTSLNESIISKDTNMVQRTVYGAISEQETKTSIDQSMNPMIRWSSGDEISLFASSVNERYLFEGEDGADHGPFTHKEGETGALLYKKVYAVYPYSEHNSASDSGFNVVFPDVQKYAKNSFGTGAAMMVASTEQTDDLVFSFKPVVGYLQIKLWDKDGSRVKSVIIESNNNDIISGPAIISLSTGAPAVSMSSDGGTSTRLDCGKGVSLGLSPADATVFWIALPPVTFSEGFTIKVVTTNGLIFRKSTSKTRTITRNTINSMSALECSFEAPFSQVDMGLSVLWSDMNLGAISAEEYGNYYAWGETETKDTYSWATYKYGNSETFSKYVTEEQFGSPDYLYHLEPCDDAATVNAGNGWRTPTSAEWRELCDTEKCEWTWTDKNGIAGYEVKSLKNGASIFLPAASYRYNEHESILAPSGEYGLYWSSDLSTSKDNTNLNGRSLLFTQEKISPNYTHARFSGRSIRPVYGDNTNELSEYSDLSASGTANSYIVSEEGKYRFKATKGNSDNSPGLISDVHVIWATNGSNPAPKENSLVNNVAFSDGYICFNATKAKGNALIAAADASGNILWSWHIWLTDKPLTQTYNNNAGIVMDRNLGATSNVPGSVEANGLLYQWGRKDPFMGASQTSYSNLENQNKAANWGIEFNYVESDQSTGTIEYAVAHPATFIIRNTINRDWLYTGDISVERSRWADKKTIYDPCPAGYKVPKGGSEGLWATAYGNKLLNDTSLSYDSSSTKGVDHDGIFTPQGVSCWYPATGYLVFSTFQLSSAGEKAYLWSSTLYDGEDGVYAYAYSFRDYGSLSFATASFRLSDGFAVRCIKE